MSRKINPFILCLVFVLFLTGCGAEQLELSEAQLETVVNYSAAILNKHNANFKSSLQNFNDESLAKLMAEEARKKLREEERQKQMEESRRARVEAENGSGSSEAGPDGEKEKQPPSLLDASAEEITGLAEALGIEGFDISYEDYFVSDVYPEASAQDAGVFGISAASGDKLLVLKFRMTNTSGEPKECSILDTNTVFRVKINGENHSVLNTLLLDDLATFEETLEAGESAGAVLIAEISEEKAENINTLVLILKGSPLREMILLDNPGGATEPSAPEEVEEAGDEPSAETAEEGGKENPEESGETEMPEEPAEPAAENEETPEA